MTSEAFPRMRNTDYVPLSTELTDHELEYELTDDEVEAIIDREQREAEAK